MPTILSSPSSVSFGYWTPDEIRRLSVVQVTQPLTHDAMQIPFRNGLFDPRMGNMDPRQSPCETCGGDSNECQGHPGHIELGVPVYNSMLFPHLIQLLQAKCFGCHALRLSAHEGRNYELKFALLARNLVTEALRVDVDLPTTHVAAEGESVGKVEDDVKRRADAIRRLIRKTPPSAPTVQAREEALRMRREVFATCKQASDCPKCGVATKTNGVQVRRDGHSKIFMTFSVEKIPLMGDALDGDEGVLNREVYMHPLEVEKQLQALYASSDKALVAHLFSIGAEAFFVRTLLVPASRFRPPRVLDDLVTLHPQTTLLLRLLTVNDAIAAKAHAGEDVTPLWLELQGHVNRLMDDAKADKEEESVGVRQIIEKKAGLFRQNLMGKRVNFAARSVISPDPYIATDQVGVPVRFAKRLSYPEPVTPYNAALLAQMVRNGPDKHPGAVRVEDFDGRIIDLKSRSYRQRVELANRLLDGPLALKEQRASMAKAQGRMADAAQEANVYSRLRTEARAQVFSHGAVRKVWRHLVNDDVVLINRQPTLHKASIMAHRVRVISAPGMQTLRMHYANCYTYNADFDGDEMNLHFPQSELARSEAYNIVYTNEQYLMPTDGLPLRGLIQDHLGQGVMLTSKNQFLSRADFAQMAHVACGERDGCAARIALPTPAVFTKSTRLWTGKQLFSCVVQHVCGAVTVGPSKSKTPASLLAEEDALDDAQVHVLNGELVRGVIDKASIGNSSKLGLVHCVYEVHGAKAAGDLLSCLGRLFTWCTLRFAHTCGVDDLLLDAAAERDRLALIAEGESAGVGVAGEFAGAPTTTTTTAAGVVAAQVARRITGAADPDAVERALDSAVGVATSKTTSDTIRRCLPAGLSKAFPRNCFSLMVASGAKGSTVNQSQVSCMLGQQTLEGRRVPRMASGRTLPCFAPFDATPRAGGYVADRFLTGVRPQEYFFHCMAGREGLLDTAVKTARSGYLQRCLVKHLEALSVAYDGTVRADDGAVVQFSYGDDGMDPLALSMHAPSALAFLRNNAAALLQACGDVDVPDVAPPVLGFAKGAAVLARALKPGGCGEYVVGNLTPGYERATVTKAHKEGSLDLLFASGATAKRVPQRTADVLVVNGESYGALRVVKEVKPDPALSRRAPWDGGVLPEALADKLEAFLASLPGGGANHGAGDDGAERAALRRLVHARYVKGLVAPGEAVGVLAAQGVGEPSTQMTLNTFHLAGHGAGNVTLGVPRLRELLMFASRDIKTPAMTLPCESPAAAAAVARRLARVSLLDVLRCEEGGIEVVETVARITPDGEESMGAEALKRAGDGTGRWVRRYGVRFHTQPAELLKEAFDLELDAVAKCVATQAARPFLRAVAKQLKAKAFRVEQGGVEEVVSGAAAVGGGEDDGAAAARGGEDDERAGDDDDDASSTTSSTSSTSSSPPPPKDDAMEAADNGDAKGAEDDDGASSVLSDDAAAKPPARKAKKASSKPASTATTAVQIAPGVMATPVATSLKSKVLRGVQLVAGKGGLSYVEVLLELPCSAPRLLLVDAALRAASREAVRSVDRISNAVVVDGSKVVTAGANMPLAWSLEGVDFSKLDCNDVGQIIDVLGVEAGRASIVRQLRAVFTPYDIDIDDRHLGLIADFMTAGGDYRPFSRAGMNASVSPLLKMTFEMSAKFVVDAAMMGEADALQTPSASIATGQVMKMGTGALGLLVKPAKERKRARVPSS